MFEHLAQVVERRLEIRGHEGPDKPIDCMQYLIDTSPRKAPWSVQRTIGEIMAVWFSSVHQLAMAATFALEDLCLHPESVEPLRHELEENADGAAVLDLDAFPLLDSFLKESSRLSVSDAISVRRKALKGFDCFNGTHVNKGDWVCVAQRAIMHDSDHYPDPEAFDAFRFVRKRPNGQRPELSRFTDAKPDCRAEQHPVGIYGVDLKSSPRTANPWAIGITWLIAARLQGDPYVVFSIHGNVRGYLLHKPDSR
ncbi:MAG: hypothetical protein L6R36_004327 [Xanthoria steineri]|nr:MAG: hypothetical protein L6R36_004327 [Xanthoria steineri]